MSGDEQGNGLRETVGELKGALTGMQKAIEALTTETKNNRTAMEDVAQEFKVHLAYHKADDKYAAQQRAQKEEAERLANAKLDRVSALRTALIAAGTAGAIQLLLVLLKFFLHL